MKVIVVYAKATRQAMLSVDLPEGATVKDAIERSGILAQFPEIDLTQQKVGIYTKAATLDTALSDGARVEIYRTITCDPKTVRRRAKPAAATETAA